MATYIPGDLALTSEGRIVMVTKQTAKQVRGQTYYPSRGDPDIPDAAYIEKALQARHQSTYERDSLAPYTPELHAALLAVTKEMDTARRAYDQVMKALRQKQTAIFMKVSG